MAQALPANADGGRRGLVTQAQAAVDLALWDIKGKIAGLPVYKLLGGRRESAPVYYSDGGWLYMSASEMVAAFEEYLAQGMFGVKMKIGHADYRTDIQRVREVRKALGDKVWIAVDANQKWDFPTAVRVGRELEQLGIAWFEEPLLCEDIPGHARLAAELDIPIAMGETLGSRYEFDAYLRADAVDILQPDIIRVGGITEMVKVVDPGGRRQSAGGAAPHDGEHDPGRLRRHGIRFHRIHALGGERLCGARADQERPDVPAAETGAGSGDSRGDRSAVPRRVTPVLFFMIHTKKTVQDILQDEMLRERAAVLARAGEHLADTLKKLEKMEGEIAAGMAAWRGVGNGGSVAPKGTDDDRRRLMGELNGKIGLYNRQREQVRTRYYYLIVTREALGIIHHQRLEEIYRIPPPKRLLPEKGEE